MDSRLSGLFIANNSGERNAHRAEQPGWPIVELHRSIQCVQTMSITREPKPSALRRSYERPNSLLPVQHYLSTLWSRSIFHPIRIDPALLRTRHTSQH